MRIQTELFIPPKWNSVPRTLQERFRSVDALVRSAFEIEQPTYRQLSRFEFRCEQSPVVRTSIVEALRGRAKMSFSMSQEITCFNKALQLYPEDPASTIYTLAQKVRSLLFGTLEPLRQFDMSISYHDWMRIAPPAQTDPIFNGIVEHKSDIPLFGAICIYLIILTAHPFSDGNGRSSRLMLNLHLARNYGLNCHYIPVSELTRATNGIYEESIGLACQNGNFNPVVLLLLDLFEKYACFLLELKPEEYLNSFECTLKMARESTECSNAADINDIPPYPVSVKDIVCYCQKNVDSTGVCAKQVALYMEIANELTLFGKISYALVNLSDVMEEPLQPGLPSIAFTMMVDDNERLQLAFRELRSKYRKRIRIQIVLHSGNLVAEAKLLINLAGQYGAYNHVGKRRLVILFDF